MKNKNCPIRKSCYDYDNCTGCRIVEEILKLHKQIDRLKNQIENTPSDLHKGGELKRPPQSWCYVEESREKNIGKDLK